MRVELLAFRRVERKFCVSCLLYSYASANSITAAVAPPWSHNSAMLKWLFCGTDQSLVGISAANFKCVSYNWDEHIPCVHRHPVPCSREYNWHSDIFIVGPVNSLPAERLCVSLVVSYDEKSLQDCPTKVLRS